jgi:3'-5' exoribonuclease 1
MGAAPAELLSGARQVIVLDLEATCWKNGIWNKKKETIEIGAIRYRRGRSSWPEFQTFVRPVRVPKLSSFCVELTGITQADVAEAPLFPDALHRFLKWAGAIERIVIATWSPYDLWQLALDLEYHQLPKLDVPHLDVKKLATSLIGGKSLEATARALDVPATEGRHRAIADARKTAKILDRLIART